MVTLGLLLSADTFRAGNGDSFMYFKVPDWIVDGSMKLLKDGELRVLIFLCRVANKNGFSWYGQKRIAETVGLSDRQVRRVLDSLEKQGFITIRKEYGKTSKVFLHKRFSEDVTPDTHVRYPGH